MKFVEVSNKSFDFNPFELIGEEWMLITAGNESAFNTMTAAWGQMGFLWRLPVASIYVRPQRYTKEFLDKTDDFTLSFFGPSARPALQLLGTKSGRDGDKVQEAGLTPQPINDSMTFEEAQLVFVCHKLYIQPLDPVCFNGDEVRQDCYPAKDYSVQYIGRIDHVNVREDILQGMGMPGAGAGGGCCGLGGGCGHAEGDGHGHGEGHGEDCCGHGDGHGHGHGEGHRDDCDHGHGGCCGHAH